MRVFIVIILFFILPPKALANSCHAIASETLSSQTRTAQLFNTRDAIFYVVLCSESPATFNVFYAQMHSQQRHNTQVPTASLSQLKQPFEANGGSRSTGFMAADTSKPEHYVLKMRTRFGTHQAVDIAKSLRLPEGDSVIFEQQGMTIGIVRLPWLKPLTAD